MSCSTVSKYSVLNFFFDGVPPPAEELSSPEQELPGIAAGNAKKTDNVNTPARSKKYFIHHPYKSDHCTACHKPDSIGFLITGENKLCIYCHDSYAGSKEKTHGPVQAGLCMKCHDPHFSKYKYFLRDNTEVLCNKCHPQQHLSKSNHTPESGIKCIGCHDPHAGRINLLKEGTEL